MTPITFTPPVTDAVTTVRRFFVAWEAGDVSELADFVDANAILGPILGLLYERTVYHGRGGVARASPRPRPAGTAWTSTSGTRAVRTTTWSSRSSSSPARSTGCRRTSRLRCAA